MIPDYSTDGFIQAIEKAGFESVGDFFRKTGTTGYKELSGIIGVPAISIIREHLSAREKEGLEEIGIKEALIRTVHEKCPNGWSFHGRESGAVRLLSGWVSEMLVTCGLEDYRGMVQGAASYLIDRAPIGWLPLSPDDRLLKMAFSVKENN